MQGMLVDSFWGNMRL